MGDKISSLTDFSVFTNFLKYYYHILNKEEGRKERNSIWLNGYGYKN